MAHNGPHRCARALRRLAGAALATALGCAKAPAIECDDARACSGDRACFQGKCYDPPGAPTNVRIVAVPVDAHHYSPALRVEWDATPGATSYDVYFQRLQGNDEYLGRFATPGAEAEDTVWHVEAVVQGIGPGGLGPLSARAVYEHIDQSLLPKNALLTPRPHSIALSAAPIAGAFYDVKILDGRAVQIDLARCLFNAPGSCLDLRFPLSTPRQYRFRVVRDDESLRPGAAGHRVGATGAGGAVTASAVAGGRAEAAAAGAGAAPRTGGAARARGT